MNQKTAPRCSGKPFSTKAQLADGFLISLVPKTSPPKKTKETRSYDFVQNNPTLTPVAGLMILMVWSGIWNFKRFPVSKKSHMFHPYC